MITIYYAGNTKPEQRTCEKFGYPNVDNKGETQYENTHFRTIEAAWEQVLREAEAGVELDTRGVREAFKMLDRKKEALIKSSLELQEAKDNYKAFQSGGKVV